jgi:hypothetical protein
MHGTLKGDGVHFLSASAVKLDISRIQILFAAFAFCPIKIGESAHTAFTVVWN